MTVGVECIYCIFGEIDVQEDGRYDAHYYPPGPDDMQLCCRGGSRLVNPPPVGVDRLNAQAVSLIFRRVFPYVTIPHSGTCQFCGASIVISGEGFCRFEQHDYPTVDHFAVDMDIQCEGSGQFPFNATTLVFRDNS